MSAGEFDRLALKATADVVAFARFVAKTEFLFDNASDADALALERWDSAGRPADWGAVWRADFAHHAAQTVAALQAVVALHFKPAK